MLLRSIATSALLASVAMGQEFRPMEEIDTGMGGSSEPSSRAKSDPCEWAAAACALVFAFLQL